MALIVTDNKKEFEKPDSGQFIGVIADVVDVGIKKGKFGDKNKVRIIWILGKADGSGYAVDSEGNPFRVMREVNSSINEKSDLFKIVRDVLGAAPPAGPYDVEQILGRSNLLFVVREKNQAGTDEFANVKGILPLPKGVAPLQVPANFTRRKDRKETGYVSSTPAQAAQPAPAPFTPVAQPVQAAAPVVNLDAPAKDESF